MIEYRNRGRLMDPENKLLPDIIQNAKKAATLNPTGAVSSPMNVAPPVGPSEKSTKRGFLRKVLGVFGLGVAAGGASYIAGQAIAEAIAKDQDNQDKVNQQYSDKLQATDIRAQIKNDANTAKK